MPLEMKYFVLKPRAKHGLDIHAKAAQAAMKTYASVIAEHDPAMSNALIEWADREKRNQKVLRRGIESTGKSWSAINSNPLKDIIDCINERNHLCIWLAFKGSKCKYSGSEKWCDRAYERCLQLGNTENFYPSMMPKGIK